jgi:hypothetical protein
MEKKKIVDELNKILKSKSSNLSQTDKRKIRSIIKELSGSNKINWKKIILALSAIAGIAVKMYKQFKE